jgi:hypothetical protein
VIPERHQPPGRSAPFRSCVTLTRSPSFTRLERPGYSLALARAHHPPAPAHLTSQFFPRTPREAIRDRPARGGARSCVQAVRSGDHLRRQSLTVAPTAGPAGSSGLACRDVLSGSAPRSALRRHVRPFLVAREESGAVAPREAGRPTPSHQCAPPSAAHAPRLPHPGRRWLTVIEYRARVPNRLRLGCARPIRSCAVLRRGDWRLSELSPPVGSLCRSPMDSVTLTGG